MNFISRLLSTRGLLSLSTESEIPSLPSPTLLPLLAAFLGDGRLQSLLRPRVRRARAVQNAQVSLVILQAPPG